MKLASMSCRSVSLTACTCDTSAAIRGVIVNPFLVRFESTLCTIKLSLHFDVASFDYIVNFYNYCLFELTLDPKPFLPQAYCPHIEKSPSRFGL